MSTGKDGGSTAGQAVRVEQFQNCKWCILPREKRLYLVEFRYEQWTTRLNQLVMFKSCSLWCHCRVCFVDDVEFEVSSDRRTGKPIAVKLVKIKPEILPEERINGQVSGYDVCFLCIQLPSFTLGGPDSLSMHANYIQNSVTLKSFFCYSSRNLEFLLWALCSKQPFKATDAP